MRRGIQQRSWWFFLFASAMAMRAGAAIINITTADNYTKIEAAQAGDEVVIAPGTYRFRVYLAQRGTPLNPIKIRALDPNNRPVWDMGATLVENAPGSYGAGDRGRGSWQLSGAANYQISGIVFSNGHNASLNAAGIRYYNGTTGLLVTDCLFRGNDNGVTGGTQDSDAVFEFCEFDRNGNLAASSATHNLYIYGGIFALRYSYVHDSVQAENFHVRARESYLEYNWFARAANYEGDLMTDDDFTGAGPFSQTMLIRGNVFIQSSNPGNHSQVLVIFNDNGVANVSMTMQIINNTYVGNGIPGNGGGAAFVHLANGDHTTMNAVVSNNIISGTTLTALIDDPAHGTMQGTNNWLKSGVSPGALTGTVFSATAGFTNAAILDLTLAAGSAAIGTASALTPGLLPTREYFQNETTTRKFRTRATARDLGALESTTSGVGIGAYDVQPVPSLLADLAGGNVVLTWPLSASGFTLEQTAALDATGLWNVIPAVSDSSPAGFTMTLPQPAGRAFYRLVKP